MTKHLEEIENTPFLEAIGPAFRVRLFNNKSKRFISCLHVVCKCMACGEIKCYKIRVFQSNHSCGCCSQSNRPSEKFEYGSDEEKFMIEKHNEGWTASKIGRHIKCNHKTVINRLRKFNLEFSKNFEGNRSNTWKGYKDISFTYWSQINRGAADRDYEFDITIDQNWSLYERQGRRCAISGVDINIEPGTTRRYKNTASLDRIDSSLGYTLGNIQWVHKMVNKIKNDLPQDEFIGWCKLITDNQSL